VKKNVPAPPSLVNIYKEMKNDVTGFTIPQHGTLIGWATQGSVNSVYNFNIIKYLCIGVLLLNACLTVRKGEANSHKDRGWENFTDSVIKAISSNFNGVVFMLWGISHRSGFFLIIIVYFKKELMRKRSQF
jgi:uracil-DNA glycosylase